MCSTTVDRLFGPATLPRTLLTSPVPPVTDKP
jgi:hypothetical protein